MFSGGGGSNATRLQSVQINASNYGKPLPIVYGRARLSTNVQWYNDFQSHAQQQGGKGGGGATSYSYTAAVMLAICEGPIGAVQHIYKGRDVLSTDSHGNTPLQQEGLTFSNGSVTQPVWSYLTSNHPDQALAYAGTAWVANSSMNLDSGAGIPNYNFEVDGLFQVGGGNVDANPADMINDLLTNSRYGAGFPGSSIADLTPFRTYCTAAGFFFSPVVDQQQQVQQYLTDWCSWANSEIVWSQGQLKLIPYADQAITGNGATYTPNLTPLFNFGDDQYIVGGSSGGAGQNVQTDPVMVDRPSPSDAYNDLKLEFLDRANNYNSAPAEAMDQAAIDKYGLRTGNQVSAHGICTASTAQLSVQLMLQRGLYERNTYTFTVGIQGSLLEPMDVGTISDSLLGLNQQLVRIQKIEEDDQFNLKITAKELVVGSSTATAQATQSNLSAGNGNAGQADPGNVSAPQFFNVPSGIISNNTPGWLGTGNNQTLQLGIAVAGQTANWGGCQIWVSLDGSTYKQYATLSRASSSGGGGKNSGATNTGARYGVLTANYPSHADPDTTDTLSIDLSASGGAISSATTTQAAAAATLSLLGGTECVSYTTATLTGTNAYNLTGTIRRGQARTPISAHSAGSSFIRLDDSIVKYSYLNEQIGSTIYVKFLSFNLFGNRLQALSDVSAYTVTLNPANSVPSAPANLALTHTWVGTQFNVSWSPSSGAANYTVSIYKSDGTTLLRTAVLTDTMYTYTLGDAGIDGDIERTYVVKVTASSPAGTSAPASLTVTKTAPAAVTGIGASGSGTSRTISWTANTEPDLVGYKLFYSTTNGFTPTEPATYNGTSTSTTLSGLTVGVTYYVLVCAYDQWSSNIAQLNFSSQFSFTA